MSDVIGCVHCRYYVGPNLEFIITPFKWIHTLAIGHTDKGRELAETIFKALPSLTTRLSHSVPFTVAIEYPLSHGHDCQN